MFVRALLKSSIFTLSSLPLKTLIDSLVLSHLIYARPVWGTMLTLAHQQRLQWLHNWGVHIAASLQKFDHVSHRPNFNWLSIPSLVKYHSCTMQQIYHLEHDTSLIVFGSNHHYHTRLSSRHIRSEHCRLSATQKPFRHTAHWWNDLTVDIVTASSFCGVFLCNDV